MSSSAYAEKPGWLVVDANILVGAILGGPTGSTRLLVDRLVAAKVALLAPEELLDDLDEHLPRLIAQRVAARLRAQGTSGAVEAAYTAWADVIAAVSVIPTREYLFFAPAARRRLRADPDDWPYLALALRMDCGLLTKNLAHFGGCGVPVWDLESIALFLEE